MPKILVVDDSVSVRKALEHILKMRSFGVAAAGSAEAALDKLSEDVPDLLIADVMMPGMDGFGLCELVRDDERYKNLPVLLISGIVNDEVLGQAKSVGVLDVVQKPFTPETLFSKIDSVLGQADVEESAAAPATSQTAEPAPRGDVRSHLTPFTEKAEVDTALLINAAGEMLHSVGREVNNPSLVATFSRTLVSTSGAFGQHLDIPELQSLYLDHGDQGVLISHVDTKTSLVLLLNSTATLSMLRYLVRKQVSEIVEVLHGELQLT